MPSPTRLTRRRFFTSTGAAALSLGTAASAKTKYNQANTSFEYEIVRSDEEWREMLSEYEYAILREGLTEKPKTSPLWEETAEGTYHCRGCDLPVFESNWKTIIDKGWVFFFHAVPDSVLMGVEGNVADYGDMTAGHAAITEIHCRRCASHLGHFLIVNKLQTHCINGTSLTFKPAAA